jgi:hypothetical protein
MFAWLVINYTVKPMNEFGEWIAPYIDSIRMPAIGFVMTYLVIVVFFANRYEAIHRGDPAGAFSFKGALPPAATIDSGEFLYFSLTTITTI